MRPLAFVIHDLNPWGGHDRSTLEIARRLSHRFAVEVHAFSLVDPEGKEKWGKVTFHRIAPDVKRPTAARIAWFFAATLPRLSLKRPVIHATGTCSLISDVVQVQFVSAEWEELQKTLPEDVCARPFARGTKGLNPWFRNLYHEALLRFNSAVERKVYTPEKTYIAIAHSVAAELKKHFGITKNVHVIHHGVDPEKFRPAGESGPLVQERAALRLKLGIQSDEVVATFVGAYERKGLATAIDSLARLSPEARARVRLLAVGGGATEGFRARARALGVEDRVILYGHTKEIEKFYRVGDIFLLPTLYEPFGLVILEAMSTGLAPVVSRLAGASELITHGVSGNLIENPADPAEVARLLEPLVLDDALRARMGAQARKVAEGRSWDRVAEEYAQVLGPLLERSSW